MISVNLEDLFGGLLGRVLLRLICLLLLLFVFFLLGSTNGSLDGNELLILRLLLFSTILLLLIFVSVVHLDISFTDVFLLFILLFLIRLLNGFVAVIGLVAVVLLDALLCCGRIPRILLPSKLIAVGVDLLGERVLGFLCLLLLLLLLSTTFLHVDDLSAIGVLLVRHVLLFTISLFTFFLALVVHGLAFVDLHLFVVVLSFLLVLSIVFRLLGLLVSNLLSSGILLKDLLLLLLLTLITILLIVVEHAGLGLLLALFFGLALLLGLQLLLLFLLLLQEKQCFLFSLLLRSLAGRFATRCFGSSRGFTSWPTPRFLLSARLIATSGS